MFYRSRLKNSVKFLFLYLQSVHYLGELGQQIEMRRNDCLDFGFVSVLELEDADERLALGNRYYVK